MYYSRGIYVGLVLMLIYMAVLAKEPLSHIERAAKRTGIVALTAISAGWLMSLAEELTH